MELIKLLITKHLKMESGWILLCIIFSDNSLLTEQYLQMCMWLNFFYVFFLRKTCSYTSRNACCYYNNVIIIIINSNVNK